MLKKPFQTDFTSKAFQGEFYPTAGSGPSALDLALISAGLTTGLVLAIDFGSKGGGNFPNGESAGGSMDASGSPSYLQTCGALGQGVSFPTVGTDAFVASSAGLVDPGSGTWSIFVTFAVGASPGVSNIVGKRDTSTGSGMEIRIADSGTVSAVIENDSSTQSLINLADANHLDSSEHFAGINIDRTANIFYASTDLVAEDSRTSLTGSYVSVNPLTIGFGVRNAMAGGVIKHLVVWTANVRRTDMQTLFGLLGG